MSRGKILRRKTITGNKTGAWTRIYRRGSRGWAFTRRHDDGASSIWPAEYRSHLRYTATVCHRHRGSRYLQTAQERERERKRKNTASHRYIKHTYHETPAKRAFWYPRAVKSPLSSTRSVCQFFNGKDRRILPRAISHIYIYRYIAFVHQ